MTTADVGRCTIVVFVGLVIQHTVLDAVELGGAHADLLILICVAGGYVAGPVRGTWFAFAVGLVGDLLLPTPFGLSALVGSLLAFATAVATAGLVRSSWWLPPATFALATAAGLTAYAVLGTVLGQPGLIPADLPPALVIATPAAAILALPVLRAVAWALPVPSAGQPATTGGAR